jgi:hypothetical protein
VARQKDSIGFDPALWIQRLRDVNTDSQFRVAEKDIIEMRLRDLQLELEALCYGRPQG